MDHRRRASARGRGERRPGPDRNHVGSRRWQPRLTGADCTQTPVGSPMAKAAPRADGRAAGGLAVKTPHPGKKAKLAPPRAGKKKVAAKPKPKPTNALRAMMRD